jgi:transposase
MGGVRVHLTESCDEALPRIITEVQTTLAPIADRAMTTPIHAALQAKDCSQPIISSIRLI